VTNFFTSKSITKDAEGKNLTTYHEFARMQLFQAFNLDDNDANLSSEFDKTEGVSSVGMRLDLMPRKYIMLTYDTDFYSTENTDASHDLMMTLDSGRGHIFRLNYQFRQDYPIDELIAETSLKLLSNVYFSTYHDYSLDKEELFKQGYGLRYIHGCWGLGLTYEKEQNDQRVALSVNLMGLGSLGGTFDAGPDKPF
jgi:LPS-assembly protein